MMRCLVVITFAAMACRSLLAQEEARPARVPADLPIAGQWHASGRQGAVAAGGAEAVAAGLEVLKAGGNAADSAVATILVLGITDADQFCLGGEVPIMVWSKKSGMVTVIAGQGAAPRLATREHFEAVGGIPKTGIESAAVPGAIDACLVLLERFGTRRFAEVAGPAMRILARGEFAWHGDLAKTFEALFAAERSTADRSLGLRRVADAFYRGPIAHRIDEWSRRHDGLLRYEDLATHVTRIEEPISATYRGLTIAKCGPWTQGPSLLEALRLLEGFELGKSGPSGVDGVHLQVEALKLAMADRDHYFADPLFVEVPLSELLSPAYIEKRRGLIDADRASLALQPGNPRAGEALLDEPEAGSFPPKASPGPDTTTCLVADAEGNVIAATPSGWDGVLAGDTGIWLGSRLQSFNIWEGHPNVIQPGKRPRITLTPTMVLDERGPILAISVAGGDVQDQVSLQVLVNVLDFRKSLSDAVTAPRFSTEHLIGSFGQKEPILGSLNVDNRFSREAIELLKKRGHVVQVVPRPIGHPIALRIDRDTGMLEAAGDPEAKRHAGAH